MPCFHPERCPQSASDSLIVGALIEETDIEDIQDAIERDCGFPDTLDDRGTIKPRCNGRN